MRLLKQSTARNLTVLMVDSADHVTGKTGLTLTITASKNGAAFAAITPTVTELATGWYSLALTTTHTNTVGDLDLHITGTGADPTDVLMQVYANDFDALATPTNITAGTITTVTNMTNDPSKYMHGSVWIDSVNGAAGTASYTNGIMTNPCTTIASAKTIADNLKLKRFWVQANSNLTMAAGMAGYYFDGRGWFLTNSSSRDISGTTIIGCEALTGTWASATGECYVYWSQVGTSTWGEVDFHDCHITGTITLNAAVPYLFDNCIGITPNSPIIDFNSTADARSAILKDFGGSVTVKNMKAGNVLIVNGSCDLTIDNTNTAGTVYIMGNVKFTNNGSGQTVYDTARWDENQNITNVTGTIADKVGYALSTTASASLVDEVWDEPLTGATHNVATSAGRRLRTVDSNVILSDVLPSQAGVATNAIKFDGGASTTDGAYDPAIITILDGAGAGQTRLIYQYDGSTKTAYVDRDWKIQPTIGSTYAIIADAGREHVNEGLCQAGGANTVTLNANASADDDAYVGQIVFLKGGTGADQAHHVIAYNGTSKVATIEENWAIQPDNTTTYVMLPQGMLDIANLISGVWSYATRTITSGGIAPADVWTYATRTLTSGGGASAADVWTYGTRTLTQAAVSPTTYITAGTLVGLRGDTFSRTITGLGSLANYAEIAFTAKYDTTQTDAESVVKLTKKPGGSDGLIYLNGATTTAAWGSITIDDATDGDITIAISADAMKEIAPNIIDYDVQIIRSSGTPVSTLAVGKWSITDDVTRNIV